MPRKSHLEEKIVHALRQAEAGQKVSDMCRKMGVSQQAFYQLEAALCRFGVERFARAAAIAEENRKLKSLDRWWPTCPG